MAWKVTAAVPTHWGLAQEKICGEFQAGWPAAYRKYARVWSL